MAVVALDHRPALSPAVPRRALRWGTLEVFVLILYLSSALLFIPGTQAVRGVIRGLPYASSLVLLLWWAGNGAVIRWGWPGMTALLASLGLMVVGLAHPEANLCGGAGQLLFQLSIVGPFFWIGMHSLSPERVRRLLGLMFLAGAASAAIGLLQFVYPDRFMPPEFSRVVAKDKVYMAGLSYLDATGRTVVRPPGLTDLPGGAATGSAVTAALGLLLAARPGTTMPRRLVLLALSGLGLVTVYLTLVRSLLMVVVVIFAGMCVLLVRQGRYKYAVILGTVAAGLVVGSFLLAVGLGGESVFERFFGVVEEGVATSYQSNRGFFLDYTLREAAWQYPMGAGMGRWGMMTHYFGAFDNNPSPPLYVEIQITGWLFDGGIPLMITYPAAILTALYGLYRLATTRGEAMAFPALVAICMNLFVVVMCLSGPSFNATSGLQFWLVTAVVFRATAWRRADRPLASLLARAQ
jgi:hypothetical protein